MEEYKAGSYRDLVGPADPDAPDADDPIVPVPIPPLVALLWSMEREQGAPLSEAEVLAVRDQAVCMTMRRSMAQKLADSRGYDDIDPENAWHEWQAVRARLTSEDGE